MLVCIFQILNQENVSGQSGLVEHLGCIWWKDHIRLNVRESTTTKNGCFLLMIPVDTTLGYLSLQGNKDSHKDAYTPCLVAQQLA